MSMFQRLEAREKYFLIAGVVCALIFILYFLISFLAPSEGHSQAKLEQAQKEYQELIKLLDQYDEAYASVGPVEKNLAATPSDFDLYNHINTLVEQSGIRENIKKMDPGQGPGTDFFSEDYVDLNLQRIDQKSLVNFLFSIDNSEEFLRISQITIKRREIDEELFLDVYPLRISVYRAKEIQ